MKTGCHSILYNGPLQRQSGGPRCTILFGSTILFTTVSSSPINTVCYFSHSPKLGPDRLMLIERLYYYRGCYYTSSTVFVLFFMYWLCRGIASSYEELVICSKKIIIKEMVFHSLSRSLYSCRFEFGWAPCIEGLCEDISKMCEYFNISRYLPTPEWIWRSVGHSQI